MNNFVSGESDASGQGPHIAFDRADVAIRRPGTFTNTEPHTTMTDQKKLNCLEQHGITDIIEFMEHVEHLRWRDYISDHQNERIIRLEHALLRVLCEIDRKFEQGHPISPTTHEVKTAWKMLREERMV